MRNSLFLIGKSRFLIRNSLFLIGKSRFLIGNSLSLIGKSRFLIGNSLSLIGKSRFLIGNSLSLIGKSRFLIGNSLSLIGKSRFLIGNSLFLIRKSRFLIGNSLSLIGKSRFLIGNSLSLIGKSRFLIGNSLFLIGKSHFHVSKRSWHVIEDHQMSLFKDVVVWAVRYRLYEVLGNRDIHPLEFGYVKARLRERAGRDFSQKLVVIGIQLFEDGESPGCSDKVNASCCRVKLDLVGTADAVQRLNDFSGLGIHDDQFPGLILVPAFDAATDKQPMMGGIQTG